MLDAPRELLFRALEPLKPDGLPPNPPPDRDEPVDGMLRLPILSPPAALDDLPLPPRLEALGEPDRLPAPPSERFIEPVLGVEPLEPPCLPACWRALAWRLDSESPRAVPPNLSAVARSA
jgi:hypothetical protein